MADIKCPACGSSKVERIDVNKYRCPYCGTTFTFKADFPSEYVINIHGYTDRFAVNPEILIKVDGNSVDKVGKNGAVQIKVGKPCQLTFECGLRSATLDVDPSLVHNVYLSFDRVTGKLIASLPSSTENKDPIEGESTAIGEEPEKSRQNNIFDYLEWLCYGLAVIDFCGMFFGYDLTGVSWSPVAFLGVGYLFNYLAKKQ